MATILENESAWSTTAATNANVDTGINWAEGQDAATVNNSSRSQMAARAKARLDQGGALAASGSADALTVTTNQVLSTAHIAAGQRLAVRATADNATTTPTFAPDGLTAATIKRADGSALAAGSIKSGMMLDLVYNAGSSEWRAVNIPPLQPASSLIGSAATLGNPGMVYLASGTVSAAASLPIVLTAYTASYRGIHIVLSDTRPVTDGVYLLMRFSTDGGSSYIATNAYDSALSAISANLGSADNIQETVSGIFIISSTANYLQGFAATEGYNGEITLLNQTSVTSWARVTHSGSYVTNNPTPRYVVVRGGGIMRATSAVNAVQFIYTSGNIAIATYAVYGLI